MDVDDGKNDDDASKSLTVNGASQSPTMSTASSAASSPDEFPASFTLALQLAFTMFSHVLRDPTQTAGGTPNPNPYLTIFLTFLATVCKQEKVLRILERHIPWQDLATFMTRCPRSVMRLQGFKVDSRGAPVLAAGERWTMLTSGCSPQLDEDWCLRGMEWVGRRVFERGYWKSREEHKAAEIQVLDKTESQDTTDGIIEPEGDDDNGGVTRRDPITLRWIRIVRSAAAISEVVSGFRWVEYSSKWVVEGSLAEKVEMWSAEERAEREAEERRRRRCASWGNVDPMDVDEDEMVEEYDSDDSDDEMDSDEVKALKARRRYFLGLLQAGAHSSHVSPSPGHRRRPRQRASARPALKIVPGYTVIVVDTNILLSFLPSFASLVESLRWTVVVPLPVIMDLDDLAKKPSAQLAEVASSALAHVASYIRTHSSSLKVQTSKGNYLTTLNVRCEQVDFSSGDMNRERNMDDLILRAAIWHDDHWVNRSALLKDNETEDVAGAVKVVMLTLDRNRGFPC
jgi:protein SMG6